MIYSDNWIVSGGHKTGVDEASAVGGGAVSAGRQGARPAPARQPAPATAAGARGGPRPRRARGAEPRPRPRQHRPRDRARSRLGETRPAPADCH